MAGGKAQGRQKRRPKLEADPDEAKSRAAKKPRPPAAGSTRSAGSSAAGSADVKAHAASGAARATALGKRPGVPGGVRVSAEKRRRMQPTVKAEAMPPIFRKVQTVCQRKAPGLTSIDDLTSELGVDQGGAVKLINTLSKRGYIAVHTDKGIPYFRWMEESERKVEKQRASKMRGLGDNARLVYQEIENAGNRGLGARELKYKTNLQKVQLRKCLETMAAKNLIKWVHTIDAKNRKIWMLKNLEPAREVKGGPWYNEEGQFDPDAVENLFSCCTKYLEGGPKTAAQVLGMLKKLPMISKRLTEMDVEFILNALTYDGVLEGFYGTCFGVKDDSGVVEQKYGYRLKKGGKAESPFTDTPCCTCPVAEKCSDGQEINPSTCKYLESWMHFN